MNNRYRKLLENIGEEEQVKAKEMLILTNMLAKIISEVDDLKAMIRQAVNDDFRDNYEGEEE